MKKLAIIGAGRAGRDYAQCAREMGVETHCFAWAQGALAKDHVDYFHDISIMEKDEITRICRQLGIDGVVATTEITIAIAAYVAQQLGLVGNPLEAAERLTDKARNRQCCLQVEELSQPGFARAETAQEVRALGFSYPLIVKPTSKGGKRGISVVYQDEDLDAAFDYAAQDAKGCPCVVEEFIDGGMECSVETLSYRGTHYLVQVTQKVSSGAPHCVELGHHQPASIPTEIRAKIERIMKRALTAIGLENGPCHTEVKIVDDKVYLIEFNARPGGDRISHPLTTLSTGFEYMKGSIRIALGDFDGCHLDPAQQRYAGICFVTEQTKELQPVFDTCDGEDWLYYKHAVDGELTALAHNDCSSTNYFIYLSQEGRPDIPWVPQS